MPLLDDEPELKRMYEAAYGETAYSFNEAELDKSQDKSTIKNRHQLRHDAESFYWVIVVFFLRALPLHPQRGDANLSNGADPWQALNHHSPGSVPDARAWLLYLSAIHWEQLLHPDLSCQVCPEYEYLRTVPEAHHVHEAMRRLLLKQIFKLTREGGDVELNTLRTRVIHPLVLIGGWHHWCAELLSL